MIQGYHAYSLPSSHSWSAGHFSPAPFVLCCVFVLVCFACVFFVLVLFCFVVRFLLCDGIVTALYYVSVHHQFTFAAPHKQTAIFASIT